MSAGSGDWPGNAVWRGLRCWGRRRSWAQIWIERTTSLPTVLSRGEVRVLLSSVKKPRFVAVFFADG